jgi:hypothetical protein
MKFEGVLFFWHKSWAKYSAIFFNSLNFKDCFYESAYSEKDLRCCISCRGIV